MPEETDYEEINLGEYIKVMAKRRRLIFAATLFTIIGAAALSFASPKVYKIESVLQIGTVGVEPIETPLEVVNKIKNDVYGVPVREKLRISEQEYPKIKIENPAGTRLIILRAESDQASQAEIIFGEINNLIVEEHQLVATRKKELLEKNISLLEADIKTTSNDIQRIRTKITSLEEEKKNLEVKVLAIQRILPYQQDPGTQFALFDTKEQLEMKKQEIESRFMEINSLESKVNSLNNQINSFRDQIASIGSTIVIKSPYIFEESVSPRLVLNISLATILGIFMGIVFAFGKEWWGKTNLKSQS